MLGAPVSETLLLRHRLGYWPRIRSPRSFNERIAYRRLFDHDPRFAKFTDKWAVREYVERTVGAEVLNPLLASAERFDDLPWDELPDAFVVKATHGCGWNHFVYRRSEDERRIVRAKAYRWLSSVYGRSTHEPWYASIPPRLVVEPLLTDRRYSPPADFKCFTFGGRAHWFEVVRNRFADPIVTFYDRDWRAQKWSHHFLPAPDDVAPPTHLGRLIEVAEALAKPFPFVRVDLYCPDDLRVVFGELTFAPSAGRRPFLPREADFELGGLWADALRRGVAT